MRRRTTILAVVMLFGLAQAALCEEKKTPAGIPVLLDTDIGDAIDDAFALALVLTSPELELRGVTTVGGDAQTKALLECRFLDAVGRPEVPAAAGESTATAKNEGMYQYGLRAAPKRPVKQDAVEFLYEQLKADPGAITIIAIGPLTNIAALLEQHPDAASWIKQLVIMGGAIRVGYNGAGPVEPEWNIKTDIAAARKVFAAGVPLVLAPLDAAVSVRLNEQRLEQIFSNHSPLDGHLQALYELCGDKTPTLYDPVAVALAFDDSFFTMESLRLKIADDGTTQVGAGKPNARVATGIRSEVFLNWFEKRVTSPPLTGTSLPDEILLQIATSPVYRLLGYSYTTEAFEELMREAAAVRKRGKLRIRAKSDVPVRHITRALEAVQLGFTGVVFEVVADERPPTSSKRIDSPNMPSKVHVCEDYETEIERRWWLSGERVPDNGGFVCRAMLCRDFDGQQGDRTAIYRAMIFNPVPGPPMGANTRLRFRYRLHGTDELRVQIFSLSKGYHRQLTLTGLTQEMWQTATVDLTKARRPDGSGGPLSIDERIDDIQFYCDADTELWIDDIALFEAAPSDEARVFPRQLIFTGGFDTGKQGVEWPGRFDIVPHEPPGTWKAAQSVIDETSGESMLRVSLRGRRPLPETVQLRLRYRLTGGDHFRVELIDEAEAKSLTADAAEIVRDRWTETTLTFPTTAGNRFAKEIRFGIPRGGTLQVDDLLLYSPGEEE